MEEKTVWQKYAGTSVRSVGKDKVLELLLTAHGRRPCPVGGCAGNRQDHDGKILARSMDGRFSRIQFTPDLLPQT